MTFNPKKSCRDIEKLAVCKDHTIRQRSQRHKSTGTKKTSGPQEIEKLVVC